MRARYCRFLAAAFFFVLALCIFAHAETPVFDATHLRGPSELKAQWLVHAGDDPAYARADFDDSQWTPFDPTKSGQDIFGKSRPSVLWYRLRVKVDPVQKDLALETNNLARAFEIYVNGERVITLGRIAPPVLYTFGAHVVAPIPSSQIATGTLLIAMRVYVTQAEWYEGQVGYGSSNLRIGQYDVLRDTAWLRVLGGSVVDGIADLLFVALGVAALVLFFSQRKQGEYFWVACMATLFFLQGLASVLESVANIPLFWKVLAAALDLVGPWVWGTLYFAFVHQRIGWRWRTYFVIAGILQAASSVASVYYPNNISYAPYLQLPSVLLQSFIIPVVLIRHWRRGNREAGILLIPVALFSLQMYALIMTVVLFLMSIQQQAAVFWMNTLQHNFVGPLYVSSDTVSNMLATISMGVIILLRSSRMSKRQAQLDAELEAAQQIQQMLVPEKTDSVPGFAVDAVYLPAQQVGGDFFQVFPAGQDGLMVVVGDVAGKGLPAALLVSTLVGAIRTAADETHAPDILLQKLNERLLGRSCGGFTTSLAAYIAKDGTMTIANAGHLPPYLDGKEVELAGALPLGVAPAMRYETRQVQVPQGGRLTFYSDGVIEAQSHSGELFGFERAREIAGESASEIAKRAQEFGQQDDITVVTIAREKAVASAA